ncbi:hypothetical protein OPV22_004464 [Ensete ventricosum]|uniref:Uncharacterized protein n=1 Tax=Ensete ventricosum TaxID=4639 RepID=A0AAV8S3U2_ENSVE|nr:hypothetical protein OPV22_004464 [Ensete ventricosum]
MKESWTSVIITPRTSQQQGSGWGRRTMGRLFSDTLHMPIHESTELHPSTGISEGSVDFFAFPLPFDSYTGRSTKRGGLTFPLVELAESCEEAPHSQINSLLDEANCRVM